MKRKIFKRITMALLGVCITGMTCAGEKELFYDAKGNPAFYKDKRTGRITSARPVVKKNFIHKLLKEIDAAQSKVLKGNPVKAATPVAPAVKAKTKGEPTKQTQVKQKPAYEIPMLLIDKNAKIRRSSTRRLRHSNLHDSSWGHGGYSYPAYGRYYNGFSRSAVPRFSRNGSYGPVRYYGQQNQYQNRGGLLLRYRHKGLELRARF